MWVKGIKIGDQKLSKVNGKPIKLVDYLGKIYRVIPNDGQYHIEVNGDYNYNVYKELKVLENYEGATIFGAFAEMELSGYQGMCVPATLYGIFDLLGISSEKLDLSKVKFQTVSTPRNLTVYVVDGLNCVEGEAYFKGQGASVTMYEVEQLPTVGNATNIDNGIVNLYIHRGQGVGYFYIGGQWVTVGSVLGYEDKGYEETLLDAFNSGSGMYVTYKGGDSLILLGIEALTPFYENGKFEVGTPCLYANNIELVNYTCTVEFGTVTKEYADLLNKSIGQLSYLQEESGAIMYIAGAKGKMAVRIEYELSEWVHLYNNGKRVLTGEVSSPKNDFNFTLDCSPRCGDGHSYIVELYNDTYTPPTVTKPSSITVFANECLTGDTLITMIDGSAKRLDEIEIGDLVATPYGGEVVIFSDAKLNKTRSEYTIYEFSDGSEIKVVKDHRIYSRKKEKYIHFSQLEIGDTVLNWKGEIVSLERKTLRNETVNHYTLFTNGTNEYFANGILCGNIFSNIKPRWLSRLLLWAYNKIIMQRELRECGK